MTTASKLTLARVFLIPVYMLFMYLSECQANIWMWLALGVFILASVTDFLDGYIARHYNQVTDFGKFMDPLADKLLTIAAMTIFCEWGAMPAWALMVVLTREFAVTGLHSANLQPQLVRQKYTKYLIYNHPKGEFLVFLAKIYSLTTNRPPPRLCQPPFEGLAAPLQTYRDQWASPPRGS